MQGLTRHPVFSAACNTSSRRRPPPTQPDTAAQPRSTPSCGECHPSAETSASDIYSLGGLLCELLTGDVPLQATADMSLRAHHLQSPAPSLRARRAGIPVEVDELVTLMLAKDHQLRPTAEMVYEALCPSQPGPGRGTTKSATRRGLFADRSWPRQGPARSLPMGR